MNETLAHSFGHIQPTLAQGVVQGLPRDDRKRDAPSLQRIADQQVFQLLATPGPNDVEAVCFVRYSVAHKGCEAAFDVEECGVHVERDEAISIGTWHGRVNEWRSLT